ncbi:hypothetical protein [Paraburkholderia atlantica]|uniref:hypothetical protein n=1 Tax=Paraburkholderia atlantica TaxID=2654982 RepID=UPI0012FF47B8|nr:hypothetical protein [Paraburkholderia atlantica]
MSLFFAGLAFPCLLIGLLALPLCGAAPTFFAAAAKKVGKEDSFKPLTLKRCSRATGYFGASLGRSHVLANIQHALIAIQISTE